MFGKHLVDRGLITEQQLIDALEQQAQMRPMAGRLAFELEMLDLDQVMDILGHQQDKPLRFCELAVELGHLTPGQRDELLEAQSRSSLPLGQVLAHMGVLDAEVIGDELAAYEASIAS